MYVEDSLYHNSKRWELYEITFSDDGLTYNESRVDLKSIAPDSWDKATIAIPPVSLEYGLYRLRFYSR